MTRIAIVGTAPSSVMLAPYEDNSWEIWTLGNNYVRVPKYDRWFELHDIDYLKSIKVEKQHLWNMKDAGNKLTLIKPHPDFPEANIYPHEQIIAEFGKYFTSSIAYQIALAIYQGAEEIGLWGIDMMGEEEYAYQRPCVEFYLGIAIARKIKITIAEQSPILRCTHLYGEDTAQVREFEGRYSELKQRSEKVKLDNAYFQGQLDLMKDLKQRWT